MSHRILTDDERRLADTLLDEIRSKLSGLADGDTDLLFAFRRKVYKELSYDERDKPAVRRALKKRKHAEQQGRCADCGDPMPIKNSHLDRVHAPAGYTPENTRLVHADCHHESQNEKDYA